MKANGKVTLTSITEILLEGEDAGRRCLILLALKGQIEVSAVVEWGQANGQSIFGPFNFGGAWVVWLLLRARTGRSRLHYWATAPSNPLPLVLGIPIFRAQRSTDSMDNRTFVARNSGVAEDTGQEVG
jgi:hypothetical protein